MRLLIVGAAALSLALSACASGPEAPLWQGYADHPQGYLGADSRFEALAFLPPPPEVDSLRAQNDLAVYRAARALKGQPRWFQAAADAEIVTPSAPSVFSEALGAPFEPERTPTLALLLGRMHADLETIQASAKASHARPRPFVSEPPISASMPRRGWPKAAPILPVTRRWGGPGRWCCPNWRRIALRRSWRVGWPMATAA